MNAEKRKGAFIISLDFELMWGVFDKRTIESYGKNILGGKQAIPRLLQLFTSYDINATWATVGFIFNSNYENLKNNLPHQQPEYNDQCLSSYKHIIANNIENDSQYYFALELVNLIKSTPGQELATHTYSHYYCLEEGQNVVSFNSDLKTAVKVAKKQDVTLKSIVFPRNQINCQYLDVCVDNEIIYYRGNEKNFLQRPRAQSELSIYIRVLRFLDSYLNLTGSNAFRMVETKVLPVNIPASSFLRPFSKKFRYLEGLKIRRIKRAMTDAAKKGLAYHLWWHPHNFGVNIDENLENLVAILKHFQHLKNKYGFESLTMETLGERLYEK